MKIPSNWKLKTLLELVRFSSGGTPSKSNVEYWQGDIPWISAATMHQQEITTSKLYISQEGLSAGSKLANKNDLLLLVRGSMLWKRIPICLCKREVAFNQDVKALQTNKQIEPIYLLYWFLTHQKFLLHKVVGTGIGAGKLDFDELKLLDILVPPILEQKRIAQILQEWDAAIEKTESLITAKKKQFGWLVTSLINKAEHHKAQVSDFTSDLSTRNRNSEIQRVLSVTNRNGFVLPEDRFERRVASADLSNYKIVEREQYAYNPSRINVGSIARLDDWDNGVLSPMYTVFKLDNKKIDSNYFLHWLSSSEAKQRIRKSAQGSVRETVSFGDLGAIPIALPDLKIQKSIAHTLNTASHEIDLLEQMVELYRTQKRGLMQKLLTGEWSVPG